MGRFDPGRLAGKDDPAMNSCSRFEQYSPAQLTCLTTTIANALAEGLDNDTVSMLSSFFFGIGSSLGLIEKQRSLRENCAAARQTK